MIQRICDSIPTPQRGPQIKNFEASILSCTNFAREKQYAGKLLLKYRRQYPSECSQVPAARLVDRCMLWIG